MQRTQPLIHDFAHPPIRTVTVEDSSRWLALAWRDMCRSPGLSIGYGMVFVVLAWLATAGLQGAGLGSLILPMLGTFLLLGPMTAVGFYEISRLQERGLRPTLPCLLAAARRNGGQIAAMGMVLLLLAYAWLQLAFLLFMLFYGAAPPSLDRFVGDVLAAPQGVLFLITGTLVGGVLAAVTFAVSAVSLPMLLDRDVSMVTAVATSLAAVRANWRVMIGWAAAIVLLAGTGMVLLYVGLALTLPLVGHASWHAYRNLVV